MPEPKREVFAVVRLDSGPNVDARALDRFSVKAVFPTMEEALAEVDRLNRLSRDKGSTYSWRATRFYPQGRPQALKSSPRRPKTTHDTARERAVLADHMRVRGRFTPPFISTLGGLEEVKWLERPLPELLWLALLNKRHGHQRGAALGLSLAKAASDVVDPPRRGWFAVASTYETLTSDERADLLRALEATGDIHELRDGLSVLLHNYPLCPLAFLLGESTTPVEHSEESLFDFKALLASLFDKTSMPATQMQANAVYIAFVTDLLKVASTTSLANFPAVADYPNTAESRRIAASVRAAINGFFGALSHHSEWPRYFWNRGLEIEACSSEATTGD